MTDSTSATTDAPSPSRGQVFLIALVALIAIGGLWWTFRPKTPSDPGDKPAVEFAQPSTKEQVQSQLENQIGEAMGQLFESPLKEITPDNIAQIEKLIAPYPSGTLDTTASSYMNTKEEGEVYRLIYHTPDTPEQVLAWFEKEWAADYLKVLPHKKGSGLPGYTLEIRVPGLHVERDVLIVAVPDKITNAPETQIWVSVRNTLTFGDGQT